VDRGTFHILKIVQMPQSPASTPKVVIDDLPLLDLCGERVRLRDYFREYLLLVFLRHLA
jgi:hypothetical protein